MWISGEVLSVTSACDCWKGHRYSGNVAAKQYEDSSKYEL